jgi:hypothetical protein
MFRPDAPPIFESPQSRADKISCAEQGALLKFSKDGKDKRGRNEWIRVVLLSLLSTTLVETVFASKAHADKTSLREDASLFASAAGIQPFRVEALNKLILPPSNTENLKEDTLSLLMPKKAGDIPLPELGYSTYITDSVNIGAGLKPEIENLKEGTEFVGVLTILFN